MVSPDLGVKEISWTLNHAQLQSYFLHTQYKILQNLEISLGKCPTRDMVVIFPLILVYKPIAYGSYRFAFSCFTDVWLIFDAHIFLYSWKPRDAQARENDRPSSFVLGSVDSSSSCIEVKFGIKLVSTQTKYRLIYTLVYSNLFMRNGLHNFMTIFKSTNHYKKLGTIGDRRRLERNAKERGPIWILNI